MEYIIPEFLREYKILYLIVFGLYLSTAYWILLFCRDQVFFLIRDIMETFVVSIGQLLLRAFDLLAYLLKTPFSLFEFLVMEKSDSFNQRKELLSIWAQSCDIDELREHLETKLENVHSVSDLSKLEASIKPFWDNWIYTYTQNQDDNNSPVGEDFALGSGGPEVNSELPLVASSPV